MPTKTARTPAPIAPIGDGIAAPVAQKQRVVVLLPSTVDLTSLDFVQVTDAARHALGQAIDLSDLVLTIAQTPLVTVRKSAAAAADEDRIHVCVKCGQREPPGTGEQAVAAVAESVSESAGEDVIVAPVAVEPRELHLGKDSEPSLSTDAPILTVSATSLQTVKEVKKSASPKTKASDTSFDSMLSRIVAPAPHDDVKSSHKPNPKAPKSAHSLVKPNQSSTYPKPPVPPSTLAYLDPTLPTAAMDPASCLLFLGDQSSLVANVAKEEDQQLKQMDELDPVDVNYFLRLLKGSPGGTAASGNRGKSSSMRKDKHQNKKGEGVDEDVSSVASGCNTGADVVDKLRYKFMEEWDEDSDDDGGFGASDDDDLSM